MELSIMIFAVVVLLVLFAGSISNVLHQLPDSPNATRKVIDRTLVEIGYFLNFKTNTKILINNINGLQQRIDEVGNEYKQGNHSRWRKLHLLVEKGIQMSEEAGKINNRWTKGWSSSCYRLGIEVGDMILKIDQILEGPYFLGLKPAMSSDSFPCIFSIFVLFIAYSFTNLVFLLSYLGSVARHAIRSVIENVTCSFNLERDLEILRIYINSLTASINEFAARNSNEETREFDKEWLQHKVADKQEGLRLIDEAEHVINHWYRGWWIGSRYMLSKKVAAKIFRCGTDSTVLGISAREVISRIDEIHHIVPQAISDIHHYLSFNVNIETLRKIQVLNDPPPNPYSSEEETREFLASVEAARMEATQLILEAEAIDRYWYKRWVGSRYSLSKRVVKMITDFQEVVAAQFNGKEDENFERVLFC